MPKSREAASFGRVSRDEHLTRPAGKTAGDVDADDLYLMANLPPRLTGLPMVVWLLERGRARHDARIKVSRTRGSVDRAEPGRDPRLLARSDLYRRAIAAD
jgi:hypothetical protein